jgi:carbamoylphosphate synthase small subunit
MSGYQEIITDPSYAKQIIAFTHPHIGNTGINDEDNESDSIFASGIVIKDLPKLIVIGAQHNPLIVSWNQRIQLVFLISILGR